MDQGSKEQRRADAAERIRVAYAALYEPPRPSTPGEQRRGPDFSRFDAVVRFIRVLFWGLGWVLVSLIGLAAIVYFVITEQWIAAIFVLLARKQLATWMKRNYNRVP